VESLQHRGNRRADVNTNKLLPPAHSYPGSKQQQAPQRTEPWLLRQKEDGGLRRAPARADGLGYQVGGKEGIFTALTSQCTSPVASCLPFEKLKITDIGASPQLQ